jgi:ParB/RepB/Spo0J family partition protein
MRRKASAEIVVTGETGVTTQEVPWLAAPPGVEDPKGVRPFLEVVQVELWPTAQLVDHPDNPRVVVANSPRFLELRASIRANGVIEPVTVRELRRPETGGQVHSAEGRPVLQVLSGHRRLAAARLEGRDCIPVRNLGTIADDLAYDIVAMGNLHEDLTPLEEGKRAAVWLDRYHQDAEAVASKLGRTPSWVVQHAQIARGLIADWQQEITQALDHEERPRWRQWTAGHLVLLARLPAALQAWWLRRARGGNGYAMPGWSIRTLEREIKIKLLYLGKAPFATGPGTRCERCLDRTGVQPLLFAETPEEASGGKERCLNSKCWDNRIAASIREDFKRRALEVAETYQAPTKGRKLLDPVCSLRGKADQIVPLSLAEPPKQYNPSAEEAYDERVRGVKKALPALVTADRITIAKEGDKGAIPGLVVVGTKEKGRQKGDVLWVKVGEKKGRAGVGAPRPRTAAEIERHKETERREEVFARFCQHLARQPVPPADVVLLCALAFEIAWPWDEELRLLAAVLKARAKGDPERGQKEIWKLVTEPARTGYLECRADDPYRMAELLGPVFGFDPAAEYAAVKGAEGKAQADAQAMAAVIAENDKGGQRKEPAGSKEAVCTGECSACSLDTCAKTGVAVDPGPAKKGAGQGQAQGRKKRKGRGPALPGVCRVCGCTDEDCAQCVEATGRPCTWVEPDLCSRCAEAKPDQAEKEDEA